MEMNGEGTNKRNQIKKIQVNTYNKMTSLLNMCKCVNRIVVIQWW